MAVAAASICAKAMRDELFEAIARRYEPEFGALRGKQFSDDSGAFRFAGVRAGSYRLIARQVGFRPFDTTVVKIEGAPLVVWISMEPLVIELAAITVGAVPRECATPGPPDSAVAPELAAVFDQLRQNAERYAFLSRRRHARLDQAGFAHAIISRKCRGTGKRRICQ